MNTKAKKLTKLEALDMLADSDHGFLWPEWARKIGEPFGVKPKTYFETVNSRAFKGLSVPGKQDGEKVEGIAAHVLAETICHHLSIRHGADIGIGGVGSRLRLAVEQIRKTLEK